ncbi:MAG: carboxypeptidase-like regulatory domain-containing protein [Isosphaeraceae bacterium]|nr:carboxypeptidase-like regulatory domain-containing protein [Isosphaeraceae bacterium]
MLRSLRPRWPRKAVAVALALLAVALVTVPARRALALIMGGEGNAPIGDPGWPKGAAAIFNNAARVAWWEGPPLGGGQWVAECRGDARALSAVLADFAKLDVKNKRVIVHDGVGHSFWLNPNREAAKEAGARVDWSFMVWQAANWQRLRTLPADLNPTDPDDAGNGPPSHIEVYTGGNVRWADVTVPDGLQVADQRLEAHGFAAADGTVLEGKVVDLATQRPIAARMRLQRVEPQPKGGYQYAPVADTPADAQGRWVLKKVPAGWQRVVIEADGYVPRVIGYGQFDGQPCWYSYNGGLSRAATVAGRVTDDAGQPLAGVDVRLQDVLPATGGRYEMPGEPLFKTGADGRFRADSVPIGRATVWVHKPGHCRPGLGLAIKSPADALELRMMKSARVLVTVDFAGVERPEGYIVQIEPEGGEVVGKWSGSSNIDAKNQAAFVDVPPGRYVLRGQPNPSSENERSKPVTVELKGGEATEITLLGKSG